MNTFVGKRPTNEKSPDSFPQRGLDGYDHGAAYGDRYNRRSEFYTEISNNALYGVITAGGRERRHLLDDLAESFDTASDEIIFQPPAFDDAPHDDLARMLPVELPEVVFPEQCRRDRSTPDHADDNDASVRTVLYRHQNTEIRSRELSETKNTNDYHDDSRSCSFANLL